MDRSVKSVSYSNLLRSKKKKEKKKTDADINHYTFI